MVLFIFFALPVATILLAIVLEKILKCPILVAITFFAIYLIVAFVSFSDTLAEAIIATIIYTILAFVTAYIVRLICRLVRRLENDNDNNCHNNRSNNECCCCHNENSGNDLLTISCNCANGGSNDLLTVSSNCLGSGNTTRTIESNNEENQSNDVAITASFTPCRNNSGRTGSVRGCYRRL